MDFSGKVALITGGGNGLGRATAAAFARHGAKVVVVDRDAAGAEATAGIIRQNGGEAIAVTADVTRSEDVKAYVRAAIETFGRIDCFFNNAGIEGKLAPTADYDEAVFDQVIDVNVKGVFLGLRHVLPEMIRQGSGAVVNTASVAGLVGTPGMPAYVASKHAVIGLTKTAAGEVARQGIRVNCRMPGTGRHAHDPCARGANRARQRGLGRRALPGGDPERALYDRGRDRQHGALPLLRPRLQHDRRTIRRRRRAYRDGRRGDPIWLAVSGIWVDRVL